MYRLKALFSKRVYLDYASVTPPFGFVYRKMADVAERFFANPSSLYGKGVEAKKLLESSRKKVADILEVRSEEIIFTASGTEVNNMAIKGALSKYQTNSQKPHVIISAIEHPSIREQLGKMATRGMCDVSVLPVGPDGLIDISELKKALNDRTVIVSIIYVNNEIGSMNDIKEIGKIIRHHKKSLGRDIDAFPYFHTDASQAFIHANMRIPELGIDMMTLDGGKCYGPRGIGVLYKKKIISIQSEIEGGAQEGGLRAGTENLPAIAGLVEALDHIHRYRKPINARIEHLHDYLVQKIKELNEKRAIQKLSPIAFNSEEKIRKHPEARQSASPHIVNICLPKGEHQLEGEFAVFKLDVLGVEVSSVTSCQNLKEDSLSYVVLAIGKPECAKHSIRISIGLQTTKSHINKLVRALTRML